MSWVESGGGRDHLVQLSVAESLSIIRNVSVPRGVTHLDLEGLVPGSRYRVEIISQAGPHRTSSQTAIGYTGREAAPLHVPVPLRVPAPLRVPVLVASLARGWGPKGAPGLSCSRVLCPRPCSTTGARLLLRMLGPALILGPGVQWGTLGAFPTRWDRVSGAMVVTCVITWDRGSSLDLGATCCSQHFLGNIFGARGPAAPSFIPK